MAIAHRETNWGAQTGTPAQGSDDQAKRHGAAAPNSMVDDDSLTVVVAVTTDQEMRNALRESLPPDYLLFADTSEQVLARPVPNNCGILIVEQTMGRAAFEHVKSHLKASAPELISIMVGTQSDGSSMVGLLSAGCIDRFMVKPLKLGPTRSALRSALQQHLSLRPREHTDRAKAIVPAIESTGDVIDQPLRDGIPTVVSVVTPIVAPKVVETARQPVVKMKAVRTTKPIAAELANNGASGFDRFLEAPREAEETSALAGVATQSQRDPTAPIDRTRQSPPSSKLAFTAIISVAILAAVGLVAWGMTTRPPELDVNKVIAGHLITAQRAIEVGNYVDPPGLSAIHFYTAALELDPLNIEAKRGIEAVADRLIADGKQLIVDGELLRAQSALDSVRRLQPNHPALVAATASLLTARQAERLTIQAARFTPKPNLERTTATTAEISPVAFANKSAALPVAGKPSTEFDQRVEQKPARMVATQPQRQVSLSHAEPAASGVIGASSTANSLGAMTVAVAAGSSSIQLNGSPQSVSASANQQSVGPTKRNDQAVPLEPQVAALRAPPNIAALPVPAFTEASGYITGSPANADFSSTATVSTSEVNGGAVSDAGKPTLIKYVQPVYPYRSRAERAEGWLDVNFLVTTDGRVVNPRVENGTLDVGFHRAALAAVTQWRFSPAPNGVKSRRPMNVRLEFRLKK